MTPIRVAILALLVGIGTAVLLSMRTPKPNLETGYTEAQAPTAPTSRPAAALASGTRTDLPDGLAIIEVKEGTGTAVKTGDKVTLHYTGRLYYGGDKFDSSYDRGKPAQFVASPEDVIRGFAEGLVGMKPGGKRELIIPPQLGYGEQTQAGGAIPGNSTLLFDVELISIDAPG
jgi:FKBP-type peptidyl-prolyl cis-trans isomerase